MSDALRQQNHRLLSAAQKRNTEKLLKGDHGYESLSDADVSSSSDGSENTNSRSDLLDMVQDSMQTPISPGGRFPTQQYSQSRTPVEMGVPGLPIPNSGVASMNLTKIGIRSEECY